MTLSDIRRFAALRLPRGPGARHRSATIPGPVGIAGIHGRWVRLAFAVAAMMAISSPQYVWTLFVDPLRDAFGATLPAIQVTFTILVVVQTLLSPLQGLLVERFGARRLLCVGMVMTGASWMLAAGVTTLTGLYLTYGLMGGVGTGIVYVGTVGLVARWFPDRRGLATGLAAAGYGFGAVVLTFPVAESIRAHGYGPTLASFGAILGVVGTLAAIGMHAPGPAAAAPATGADSERGVGPHSMLRSGVFWLLFLMMSMMSTGGLMVISQMGPFAREFGVAQASVLGMAALPLAMTIDRVTNGLTRPFFGWISDRIGRENAMGIAFSLEGVAVLALLAYRDDPVAFVVLSGVVFFGWGEIFSLFPATLADTFGTRHAALNYGFLYVAQGVGALLGGPIAAALHDRLGGWLPVFHIVILLDAAAAALALAVLKPLRARYRAAHGG